MARVCPKRERLTDQSHLLEQLFSFFPNLTLACNELGVVGPRKFVLILRVTPITVQIGANA